MPCHRCGTPETHTETHHVDTQRGNNDPDNLSERCRRCHHDGTHDNARAVDDETRRRYGPRTPRVGGPTRPTTNPP